ncbi:beta-lactamase domain-containing protein [Ketogulonicigenium robustum]|uniref:Beta-lactamase domain-containing protein n=1 Tax=Ketogulonicigenium robustum TaxID=92947 RepID=A0A1W6NW37_9RHOB|nr:MBL fold metallo-hydrolase [Ketogulonicigenium robustum]ARO13419.1 beta-lactamase domain-containing protein [Ketogulonicigenium robustum]
MPEAYEVTLLRVGYCRAPERLSRRDGGLRPVAFPAGAALLRHPRHGSVLFDTGYGRAFFDATAPFPERLYRWLTPVTFHAHESLANQLRAEQPDRIVLSHLHADHVAGLFDLAAPLPPVLASAPAMAALKAGRLASLKAGLPEGLRDNLRAIPIAPIQALPPVDLTPWDLAEFGTGFDLFGDQSALIVPLPGHGTGQVGLFVPHTSTGPTFLVADAAWGLSALRANSPPPRMTLARLGDANAYLATFARLVALHRRAPHVRIVASHCPENFPPHD